MLNAINSILYVWAVCLCMCGVGTAWRQWAWRMKLYCYVRVASNKYLCSRTASNDSNYIFCSVFSLVQDHFQTQTYSKRLIIHLQSFTGIVFPFVGRFGFFVKNDKENDNSRRQFVFLSKKFLFLQTKLRMHVTTHEDMHWHDTSHNKNKCLCLYDM